MCPLSRRLILSHNPLPLAFRARIGVICLARVGVDWLMFGESWCGGMRRQDVLWRRQRIAWRLPHVAAPCCGSTAPAPMAIGHLKPLEQAVIEPHVPTTARSHFPQTAPPLSLPPITTLMCPTNVLTLPIPILTPQGRKPHSISVNQRPTARPNPLGLPPTRVILPIQATPTPRRQPRRLRPRPTALLQQASDSIQRQARWAGTHYDQRCPIYTHPLHAIQV